MSPRALRHRAVSAVAVPLAVAVLLTGCAVRQDYSRPALDLPATHRGKSAPGPSLATSDWRTVFDEPAQQALIEAALTGNVDLKIAEARIRSAQAAVALARSALSPSIGLGLATSPIARRPDELLSSSFLAAGLLRWEIDLWDRIGLRTQAAQGDLAATEAARDGARVSLIAEIASRYEELATLRAIRIVTDGSALIQAEALRLVRRRNQSGLVSAAEVRQAEGQLASTGARLPELRRQEAALENALSLLTGRAPAAITTAIEPIGAVAAVSAPVQVVPAGLPSELIDRRPDLREAEQRLMAANARVGEARALMLPSLSLTGTLGRIGFALEELVSSSSATVASIGPNVSQALYDGGALEANRAAALARLDEALLGYRRVAFNALREVADALKSHEETGLQLQRQAIRVVTQRDVLKLANRRYAAGVVSFLEVLDAQRQLLAAETDFLNTRLANRVAYVQVYRSLGGGWGPSAAR